MKKFFAIVAAALVAFSFTSCQKEDVGSSFFKITVSNIESTTADLAIAPADTTVYYGVGIYYSEDVVKYTADTIAAEEVATIAKYVEMGYELDYLAQHNIAFKGKLETPLVNLPANTEFTVIAYRMIEQNGTVALGDVSYKNFKTKDIELAGEENLGVLEQSYFDDYREDDGSYIAYGYDAEETKMVALNIYDEDCAGNFTEADLDPEYSYIWTVGMNEEYGLPIVKAELESKLTGEGEATIKGWAIASNMIKYQFSFTHSTVDQAAEAPKKAVAKKSNELKPATLKVSHIRK